MARIVSNVKYSKLPQVQNPTKPKMTIRNFGVHIIEVIANTTLELGGGK